MGYVEAHSTVSSDKGKALDTANVSLQKCVRGELIKP